MAIEFRCTNCGEAYRSSDRSAGRAIACQSCLQILHVPQPSAPSAQGGRGSTFRSTGPTAPTTGRPTASLGRPPAPAPTQNLEVATQVPAPLAGHASPPVGYTGIRRRFGVIIAAGFVLASMSLAAFGISRLRDRRAGPVALGPDRETRPVQAAAEQSPGFGGRPMPNVAGPAAPEGRSPSTSHQSSGVLVKDLHERRKRLELGTATPNDVTAALDALRRANDSSDEVVAAICDCLYDQGPPVVLSALAALERLRPDLHKVLSALCLDESASARTEAVRSLGRIGNKAIPAKKALVSRLKNSVAAGGSGTPVDSSGIGIPRTMPVRLLAAVILQIDPEATEPIALWKEVAKDYYLDGTFGQFSKGVGITPIEAIKFLHAWAGNDWNRRRELLPILSVMLETNSNECVRLALQIAGEYAVLSRPLVPRITELKLSPSGPVRELAGTALRQIADAGGPVEVPGVEPPGPKRAAEPRRWAVTESATLTGHSREVCSVAFSPDSKTLASGSGDGTVKLWDLATGRPQHTLHLEMADSSPVAFSPDGRLLACGNSTTVSLWEVTTGKRLPVKMNLADDVLAVAFSPDGKLLASAGRRYDRNEDRGKLGDEISVWDPATGKERASFHGHKFEVFSLAFSPDSRTLASAGSDSICLWDVAGGRKQNAINNEDHVVTSVAFSPDGTTLASVGSFFSTAVVKVWDLKTGKKLTSFKEPSSATCVAFSPDGNLLSAGYDDGTIVLWDWTTSAKLAKLTKHSSRVNSLAFSPDGKALASASSDDTVKLWTIAPAK